MVQEGGSSDLYYSPGSDPEAIHYNYHAPANFLNVLETKLVLKKETVVRCDKPD